MRIGIVGYGESAGSFAAAAYVVDGVELVFVGGRNPEKASRLAGRYGVASGTTEDLLARDDVDCVCISTPPGRHAEDVLPFLKRGTPAMIEKPMCLTEEDCRRVIETAEDSGAKIMVTQTWRYTRANRLARRLIESGDYGRVLHVGITSAHDYFTRKRSGWQLDWALSGGGVCLNPFIHMIDLARWLACSEVARIQGRIGFFKPGFDIEGNVHAYAEMESGATAFVEVQGYGHRRLRRAEVMMEKATLIPQYDELRVDLYWENGIRKVVGLPDMQTRKDGVRAHDGYCQHMIEMRDALEKGGPITSDGHNGLRNVVLANEILRQNGVTVCRGRSSSP